VSCRTKSAPAAPIFHINRLTSAHLAVFSQFVLLCTSLFSRAFHDQCVFRFGCFPLLAPTKALFLITTILQQSRVISCTATSKFLTHPANQHPGSVCRSGKGRAEIWGITVR